MSSHLDTAARSNSNRFDSHRFSEKVVALWTIFLLGTLFHTQLGLMPLFHDMSVAESHADFMSVNAVFWFMLIFFLLPMLAIALAVFSPGYRVRVAHFGMTVVYSVFNLAHLIADISVGAPSYQLTLMVVLLLIGLVLNVVGYQWMKSGHKRHQHSH